VKKAEHILFINSPIGLTIKSKRGHVEAAKYFFKRQQPFKHHVLSNVAAILLENIIF